MLGWGIRWKGDVSGYCLDDWPFGWYGIVIDDWNSMVDARFYDRYRRSIDQRYSEDGFEKAKILETV